MHIIDDVPSNARTVAERIKRVFTRYVIVETVPLLVVTEHDHIRIAMPLRKH